MAGALELDVPSNQASLFVEKFSSARQIPDRVLDLLAVLVNWLHIECIARQMLA